MCELQRTLRLLSAALLLPAAACFFDFERGLELEPGDVAGRALRGEDEGAPFAKVTVDGLAGPRRAGQDGAFVVSGLTAGGWLVRLADDDNGDGWPERAATRSFAIEVISHSEGLFGQSEPRETFVSLGDVALAGVVEARGRVVLDADDAPVVGAKVYAYRTASLPGAETADGAVTPLEVDLGPEAVTTSDTDGRFRFPALPAGALSFVSFHSNAAGTAFASVPEVVEAAASDDIAEEQLVLRAAPAEGTRPAQIELTPAPTGLVRVDFVAPGESPPSLPTTAWSADDPEVYDRGRSLALSAPLGVWDVWVRVEDGPFGVLFERLVTPPGRDLLIWGPVQLSLQALCEGTDAAGEPIRDCDLDRHQGLPELSSFDPAEDADVDVWVQCASQCADAFGAAEGGATCEAGGETYDCDDDGDGQPDVTEHFLCYGLGRGTDLDADGLCSDDDPYPQCASNDPTDPACGADRDDAFTPPPVPDELGAPVGDAGPPPADGGTDGGVTDGGVTDGGVTDGGPVPVDGGGDAGDDGGAPPADAGTDAGVDPVDGGPETPFAAGPFGAWAQRLADRDVFEVRDVGAVRATAAGPAIYVTGMATGTVELGDVSCTVTGAPAAPVGVIVAYDDDGNCLWTRTLAPVSSDGGTGSVDIRALAVDPTDGDVEVVGAVTAPVQFEGIGIPYENPAMDVLRARYDRTGMLVGGIGYGVSDDGTAVATDVTFDANGNAFVVGTFESEVDFQGSAALDPVVAVGSPDVFLVEIDDFGFSATRQYVLGATGSAVAPQVAVGSLAAPTLLARATGTVFQGTAEEHALATEATLVAQLNNSTLAAQRSFVVDGLAPEATLSGGTFGDVDAFVLAGSHTGTLTTTGAVSDLSLSPVGARDGVALVFAEATASFEDVAAFAVPSDIAAGEVRLRAAAHAPDGAVYVAGSVTDGLSVETAGGTLTTTSATSGVAEALIVRLTDDPLGDVVPAPLAEWVEIAAGASSSVAVAGRPGGDAVLAGALQGQGTLGELAIGGPLPGSFLWRLLADGTSGAVTCTPPDTSPCAVTGEVCDPDVSLCVPDCRLDDDWCPSTGRDCDDANGRCVAPLFPPRGDTWVLGTDGVWRQETPSTAPEARYGAASGGTYGPMWVFGGRAADGVLLDDTWRFDGTTWQEVSALGPSARVDAASAVTVDGALWVFGGLGRGGLLGDLWRLGGSSWTSFSSALSPSPRRGAAAAFDTTRDRLVIYGGVDETGTVLDDLWAFNLQGNFWEELTYATGMYDPGPVVDGAMTIDPSFGDRPLLFSGIDDTGAVRDTNPTQLAFGGAQPQWLPSFGDFAPGGEDPSLLYDYTFGRIVQIGGLDASGSPLGQAYTFSNFDLSMPPIYTTGPGPRGRFDAAVGAVNGEIVVFGGRALAARTLSVDAVPTLGAVSAGTLAFTPATYDAQGALTVASVGTALPGWIALDSGTGQLAGTAPAQPPPAVSGAALTVDDGSTVVTTPPFDITVAPRPTYWWTFDAGCQTGGITVDAEQSEPMDVVGDPVSEADQVVGAACAFADTDYAAATGASLSGTSLSVSFWVRIDDAVPAAPVVAYGYDGSSSGIAISADDVVSATWHNGSVDLVTTTSQAAVDDGAFHHVVVTVDASLGNRTYVYVDGRRDGTAALGTSIFYGGNPLEVGRFTAAPSAYLQGAVDELAVWDDHALGREEVKMLYHRGRRARGVGD